MSDGAPPRVPSSPDRDAAAAPAAYRQRILSALRWNVSGEVAAQGLRFMFGIVLARLLAPRDFGLMAMLMVLDQVVITNADLGFEEALIQRREITEVQRSSVFWTLILVGVALAACQIAAAPWISKLYGADELAHLAVGLSGVFVLRVLGSVPRAIIARKLNFRLAASCWFVAVGVAGVCAVPLAWYGFGPVSLLVELLVSTGVESFLLFTACHWRPRWELRTAALRELMGFSAYRPFTRALNFWAQRFDQLLVGTLLGSNALGLYARAFNVTRFPVVSAARALADVMFPSLAGIQEDAAQVRSLYLRTIGAVALACVPIAMGLFATAEPFVLAVLGPQWQEAIPILRILTIAGLCDSLTLFATGLYLALGRADLVLRITIAQRVVTIGAVVCALRWGVIGVALAQMLSAAVNVLVVLYWAGRLIELPMRHVLRRLAPIFAAGVLMVAVVGGMGVWVNHTWGIVPVFALEVILGVVTYWAALYLLRVGAYRDLIAVMTTRSMTRLG